MAYESYSEFVAALDAAGELIRVTEPVATELEITAVADREMKKSDGGKALLFEKPTIDGQVSPFPVAINTMGSARRMAMSMGADSVGDVAEELGSLMKAKPPTSFGEAAKLLRTALELRHARPKTVKTGPCKEVVHRFDGANTRSEPWPAAPDVNDPTAFTNECASLLDLPILKCWPFDGGRFVTLPVWSRATQIRVNGILACIACRFTTAKARECTGSCRRSPRAMADVTTRPASECRWRSFLVAIPCFHSVPPRPCRMGLMNFSWLATSDANQSGL